MTSHMNDVSNVSTLIDCTEYITHLFIKWNTLQNNDLLNKILFYSYTDSMLYYDLYSYKSVLLLIQYR